MADLPPVDPESGGAEETLRGMAGAARDAWRDERVEVVAAVLLSLATVLSAWGAYQATRWGGNQANSYALAAELRSEAATHTTTASRQIEVDTATFIGWSDAALGGDQELADFIEARFRPEFTIAFEEWLGDQPPDLGDLPSGTPFDQPEYVLAEHVAAVQKTVQAEEALLDAQNANQTGDDFVLTAVLFASVLFFAGVAARLQPQWLRWTMLVLAVAVFLVGLSIEFSLPQNVGF
jgi:hypothetical protein